MKIGCLHAHYSNISYIEQAAAPIGLELIHFVDPGLIGQMTANPSLDRTSAQNKVIEQIEWISRSNVDAILITCTHYIAYLDEERLNVSVPIIKIDEPFFHYVCQIEGPQVLLFTNPATVEGTMDRLNAYAHANKKQPGPIQIHIIEDAFELVMQGKKEQYAHAVSSELSHLLKSDRHTALSVVQLSMVEAAERTEHETGISIGKLPIFMPYPAGLPKVTQPISVLQRPVPPPVHHEPQSSLQHKRLIPDALRS